MEYCEHRISTDVWCERCHPKPKALMSAVVIILESVPIDGIPSGHLYAALNAACDGVGLSAYVSTMNDLKAHGVLSEKSHMLRRGPNYESALKGFKSATGMV